MMTLAVFGPYSMIYFVVYERLRQLVAISQKRTVSELTTPVTFACAASAAGVSAAVTTPLDVVKTRLQTQQRYRSGLHAFLSILREEGPMTLTRGLSSRVIWIMPGTAVTMTAFEWLKHALHQ